MHRILLMLVMGVVLFAGMPALSHAADEELFDTKAAAVYVDKGIAHLKKHNFDEAIAELEEAVSIAPNAEGFYYLGYAYYLKGKAGDNESRKKSLECFDKAYELDPNFTPSKFKPADAVAVKPQEKKGDDSESATVVQPGQPGQQNQPAEQPQPSEELQPQTQPERPANVTDRVKHIGNVPAVP